MKPPELTISHHSSLVGGFNHLEKYEFVNGKGSPIYEMENNPAMFETSNQIYFPMVFH
jgi:hypothetical protein